MRFFPKYLPLVVVTALMAGCRSLAMLRVPQTVRAGRDTAVVGVWVRASGPSLSDPECLAYNGAIALVFYPVNVVSSTCVALSAPCDPNLDISWGPVGAVVGIVLPGVTLIPYFYPPGHVLRPLPEVVISSSSLDEIVSRIKAGDGLRAYREIVGQYPWHGESDAMISIELIEDRHVEVAQQGAAAEAPERARS